MASNRRAFLTATAVGALATAPTTATAVGTRPRPTTAPAALAELLDGNRRYASGHSRHPDESRPLRHQLATAQHPFAVIVGCIDSRVPPELVFDQGLGDLLCIRTAGEVLDEAVLASIQYGVEELRIPLVLVLGHERCGAVAATLAHLETGAPVPGHLALLVDEIAPAARRSRALPGDWAEHTMTAHTAWVRDAIRADPAFASAQVVAARFDLDTGLVSLLP
ncbi:carbonic anhydrase [Streptomyces sp. 3213]|uniref:carbonic anhydrase n=1 Tax=Streptomyces sp. 3213.3 TaxID=1855348 RepID=UPI0008973047|nr:carbonic anhydrase [Streptomyces sp. 3213.3]SEE29436.1 carbonic anhydrase [Streptomyces sp. 3213] [Streptomyces sp. 3213.3]